MLRDSDYISGKEGVATAVLGGQVVDLFYVKSLEATMEKKKTELNSLGKRSSQHKTSGWSGKGSLTIYYITSDFRELAAVYNKTGKDIYFTMTVTNEDPASSVGKQTTVLYNCNLDTQLLAKIDVDAEVLDEDADFTFDDFDILNSFDAPSTI